VITLSYTTFILILLAVAAVSHAVTFFPTRAHFKSYITRNKDLRRQIAELTSGHHMDADQWRDLERQLAERTALLKQDQAIGLFLRNHYSAAQLDQHKGMTTAEVVIMRLRQGIEGRPSQ
jgi:hypothetical protein